MKVRVDYDKFQGVVKVRDLIPCGYLNVILHSYRKVSCMYILIELSSPRKVSIDDLDYSNASYMK